MAMNDHEDSELIFGWIDYSRFVAPMKWYPVVNKLFWSLELDDIKVILLVFSNFCLAEWKITQLV